MAGLAGGAWLGIGIGIGFIAGIMISALFACLRRPRTEPAPNAPSGGFTSLTRLDANRTVPATPAPPPLPSKQPSQDNFFYSPLQSSIVKGAGTNVRVSMNNNSLPDPAAYGSHGIAILHVHHPVSSQPVPSAQQPQPVPAAPATDNPDCVTVAETPITAPAPAPANLTEGQAQPLLCRTPPPPNKQEQQQSRQKQQQQHQRMLSVADAYGAEDLDDEWAVVLGDLDGLLAKKGQPGLASPERAVAVRRLIAVTGSRGMQFALEAALQDVLRFRSKP